MPREVVHELSPRENEILRLASEGFTDTAIAHKLDISEGTVGTYWGRIRTKLGPFPRTELIALRIRDELQAKMDALTQDRDTLSALLHNAVEEEGLYEGVVDASDEGVIIVSREGLIDHGNPAAHAMFGYPPGHMKNLRLVNLVPEQFRRSHLASFEDFCRNPDNGKMHPHLETVGLHHDGSEIPLSINISAVKRGETLLLTGFFRPLRPEPGT